MEKIKRYAELFGGVLVNIAECEGNLGENKNLDNSLEQLDIWIESKFVATIDDDVLNWLNSPVLDKLANTDYIFRLACINGYLPVVRWLHSLGHTDFDCHTFVSICSKGHLEVAKWYYSLYGVEFYLDKDIAFRNACYNGHLAVAQWLFSLNGGFYNYGDHIIIFENICENGYLDMAKWFYQEGGVVIARPLDNNKVFELACKTDIFW